MHRKNNLSLSFTRESRVVGLRLRDTGLVQSKRRLKGASWDIQYLKRSRLVLAPQQKRRMRIQPPSHGRSTFRALNRELLMQSLHGNCSISLMASVVELSCYNR